MEYTKANHIASTSFRNLIIFHHSKLHAQILTSLTTSDKSIFDFDYEPTSISTFSDTVTARANDIMRDSSFSAHLDMDGVSEMLKKCTALQTYEFRAIFYNLYYSSNIRDFLSNDKENLEKLYGHVVKLKDFSGYDKIQKRQLEWFAANLNNILNRL